MQTRESLWHQVRATKTFMNTVTQYSVSLAQLNNSNSTQQSRKGHTLGWSVTRWGPKLSWSRGHPWHTRQGHPHRRGHPKPWGWHSPRRWHAMWLHHHWRHPRDSLGQTANVKIAHGGVWCLKHIAELFACVHGFETCKHSYVHVAGR